MSFTQAAVTADTLIAEAEEARARHGERPAMRRNHPDQRDRRFDWPADEALGEAQTAIVIDAQESVHR